MESVDVAVIGAGVHGASAAYFLAEFDVRTVVFDRGAVAGGPTGRSAAICRGYYRNSVLADVARESIAFFASFAERTGGREAGFRRTGILFLHPEDASEVLAAAGRLNALGTRVEVLDQHAIAVRFPRLSGEGIEVAAWEPDAGYADPVLTTTGLLDCAAERGVKVRPYCGVTSIDLDSRGGAVLQLGGGGAVQASKVLVAAGPWTGHLLGTAGIELPLTVQRHYMASFGWGDAAPIAFSMDDVESGFYLKPEGEHLFIVGSLHPEPSTQPEGFNEGIADDEVDELVRRLIRRVPDLAGADSRGGWASLYDVSPDWQPVIGEVAPGVYVDAGTSGHGFKLAPGLGRHIANLMMGAAVDRGVDQFHPDRFSRGEAVIGGWGDAPILG